MREIYDKFLIVEEAFKYMPVTGSQLREEFYKIFKNYSRGTIIIIGNTQTGKTTFSLHLMGLGENKKLYKALRGKRKFGESATPVPIIYEYSDKIYISLDGKEKTFLDLPALSEKLYEIRKQLAENRMVQAVYLGLPMKNKFINTLIDLPGLSAADKNERLIIRKIVSEFAKRAHLALIVVKINHISDLAGLNELHEVMTNELSRMRKILIVTFALTENIIIEKLKEVQNAYTLNEWIREQIILEFQKKRQDYKKFHWLMKPGSVFAVELKPQKSVLEMSQIINSYTFNVIEELLNEDLRCIALNSFSQNIVEKNWRLKMELSQTEKACKTLEQKKEKFQNALEIVLNNSIELKRLWKLIKDDLKKHSFPEKLLSEFENTFTEKFMYQSIRKMERRENYLKRKIIQLKRILNELEQWEELLIDAFYLSWNRIISAINAYAKAKKTFDFLSSLSLLWKVKEESKCIMIEK